MSVFLREVDRSVLPSLSGRARLEMCVSPALTAGCPTTRPLSVCRLPHETRFRGDPPLTRLLWGWQEVRPERHAARLAYGTLLNVRKGCVVLKWTTALSRFSAVQKFEKGSVCWLQPRTGGVEGLYQGLEVMRNLRWEGIIRTACVFICFFFLS